jgi:sugar phosphate isomerase/epimerase|tara:strand:- start:338 stop:1186 length:849 start_codon:yes stop_codon:yes gene_type:complete
MKNIFVSTTFAKDDSKISDVLAECKKENISNVELGSNHIYEKDLKKIIQKYNFRFLVHNYFPIPKKSFVVNIASLNKKIRTISIQHIKKAINFCKVTNSKLYTMHPGFLADPITTSRTKNNYDFIWNNNNLNKNYNLAFNNMLSSLKKIVHFAKNKKVRVAIETEGSFKKKNLLLMQKPNEYKELFKYFKPNDLGINLNIGHLNLASRAFKFSKFEFVNELKQYILAIELSHNNGIEDQHLPLKKNEWYWKIINDPDFSKIYKILEFRNTDIKKMKKVIELF